MKPGLRVQPGHSRGGRVSEQESERASPGHNNKTRWRSDAVAAASLHPSAPRLTLSKNEKAAAAAARWPDETRRAGAQLALAKTLQH